MRLLLDLRSASHAKGLRCSVCPILGAKFDVVPQLATQIMLLMYTVTDMVTRWRLSTGKS